MATTATPPTTELGSTQRFGWSQPVLDERETARDLRYPQNVKTFTSMLNDAQVDGLYKGATLPIRAYHWYLDPNGAPAAIVDRISTDYGLPIGETGSMNQRRTQGRFRFDRHLEDALRAIALGHYPFEQVGDIGPDLLWHLRKLAPRPPATVTQIKPARDGGLEFIRVPSLKAGDLGIQGGMRGGVEIPVNRLLMYVWDQEGANWTGRSMLRSSYRPWKLKDRVLRVGAINIDRAGGVPYIEAPAGANSADLQALHALAAAFRVGESAGAALPHGATLKFARAAGGDEAINYVRLQNEEMARAWLMMFMQSGQSSSGHGSTQQVESQMDYFAGVQKAIAGWFCDVFNEHMIEDDVEWNEGPEEPFAPLLRFKVQGDPLDALAGQLDNAQTAGALPANSPVAAAVKRETRQVRRPPAARAATSPAASPADLSQTDFAALQSTFEQALTDVAAAWDGVRSTVVDELVGQVQAATTIAALAALAVPIVTGTVLLGALTGVVDHGAQSAVDAAAAQGGTVPMPDLATTSTVIAEAADATAMVLAGSLTQSAASHAVGLWGTDPDPGEIATAVREHLASLAGAAEGYEFAGLVSRAQNEGRFAAMEEYPAGSDFYASSVNDTNSCLPCREEDDTDFPSMLEARRDFPAGGFLGCLGGKRCRCTVVAVLPETAGQAA